MADKNSKDTINEFVQQAKDRVEPQLKKAKDAAQPYIEKVEPTINKAKERIEPTINKAKEKVEPQIKKAREKAEPVVKEATSRAAKAVTKTEVFLQYGDFELRIDDIVDKVRGDFLGEDKKARDLKQLRIYLKPEDRAAYYVANGHDTGKVQL